MFVRYTIQIFGENFSPTKVQDKLITNLKVIDCDDHNKEEFGYLCLQHVKEFSIYRDEEYENEFVDFFENNFQLLTDVEANNFSVMLEVYYSDQCNFEIFDNEALAKLAKYKVNIPISVYYIEPENNENEIENIQ